MADPLALQVLDALLARLRVVTVAGGYRTDLGLSVHELFSAAPSFGQSAAGVFVGVERESIADAQQVSLITTEMTVLAWHAVSRAHGDRPQAIAMNVAADLEQAIKLDTSLGDLVNDCQLLAWQPQADPEDSALVWVNASVRLNYYRDFARPDQRPLDTGDVA
jgi:hypothetical protein